MPQECPAYIVLELKATLSLQSFHMTYYHGESALLILLIVSFPT